MNNAGHSYLDEMRRGNLVGIGAGTRFFRVTGIAASLGRGMVGWTMVKPSPSTSSAPPARETPSKRRRIDLERPGRSRSASLPSCRFGRATWSRRMYEERSRWLAAVRSLASPSRLLAQSCCRPMRSSSHGRRRDQRPPKTDRHLRAGHASWVDRVWFRSRDTIRDTK